MKARLEKGKELSKERTQRSLLGPAKLLRAISNTKIKGWAEENKQQRILKRLDNL